MGEDPPTLTFVRKIERELKIRGYSRNSITSYRSAVHSLLRWFGRRPSCVDREVVRDYLEYLVDSGSSLDTVGVQLSAIRTFFDKLCFCDVTLGLETPRKPKHKPAIPSRDEIRHLLQAATSLRNTLLIGLGYATGMRVSELVRVQWRDFDFDRNQIMIRRGKGNADRNVRLPESYRALLTELSAGQAGHEYVFPSEAISGRKNRHLSARTVERVLERTCKTAGIKKRITPHSLRHAFATHSFEDGCDIRRIQAVLGHVRLETTTLYVKLAKSRTEMVSPLDRLQPKDDAARPNTAQSNTADVPQATAPKPVGRLRIHTRPDPTPGSEITQVTIEITGHTQREFLLGIRASMPRPGFITLQIPPLEKWQPVLSRVSPAQASRIAEPSFYELLQREITRRLLSVGPTASPGTG